MSRHLGGPRAWAGSLGAAILALGTATCQQLPLLDGLPTQLGCSSCHGNEENPAPPYAVNGATSTREIGVGAHQAHVTDGPIAGMYGCDECHPLPARMDGDSHPDPLARGTRMLFGPVAQTNGATPAWDRNRRTCTNTYCHGATLADATTPAAPDWTRVDGSQSKCNSCHADRAEDLGDLHPAHRAYTCAACHAAVVASGQTVLDPYLHVNGMVDVQMAAGTWDRPGRSCADTSEACHGNGSVPW